MQLESDPFIVIHNLILLLIFEEETNHVLLGQLYTLAHCRAYRLFGLLQLNNTIRVLLYRINGSSDDKVQSVSCRLRVYLRTVVCGCLIVTEWSLTKVQPKVGYNSVQVSDSRDV
jgi:hypothetical protein